MTATTMLDSMTDAQAVSRVLVCEALAASAKASRRVRLVARRLVAVYEVRRGDGLGHAESFRLAWEAVRPLAEAVSHADAIRQERIV